MWAAGQFHQESCSTPLFSGVYRPWVLGKHRGRVSWLWLSTLSFESVSYEFLYLQHGQFSEQLDVLAWDYLVNVCHSATWTSFVQPWLKRQARNIDEPCIWRMLEPVGRHGCCISCRCRAHNVITEGHRLGLSAFQPPCKLVEQMAA